MAVKLERQLHVAVTKQGLYSFWIGSHADQKRCQTVAKVVEAEIGGDHRPRVGRVRLDAMKEFQLSLQPAADNLRGACWRRAAVCPLDDPMGTPSRPVANRASSVSSAA